MVFCVHSRLPSISPSSNLSSKLVLLPDELLGHMLDKDPAVYGKRGGVKGSILLTHLDHLYDGDLREGFLSTSFDSYVSNCTLLTHIASILTLIIQCSDTWASGTASPQWRRCLRCSRLTVGASSCIPVVICPFS